MCAFNKIKLQQFRCVAENGPHERALARVLGRLRSAKRELWFRTPNFSYFGELILGKNFWRRKTIRLDLINLEALPCCRPAGKRANQANWFAEMVLSRKSISRSCRLASYRTEFVFIFLLKKIDYKKCISWQLIQSFNDKQALVNREAS